MGASVISGPFVRELVYGTSSASPPPTDLSRILAGSLTCPFAGWWSSDAFSLPGILSHQYGVDPSPSAWEPYDGVRSYQGRPTRRKHIICPYHLRACVAP